MKRAAGQIRKGRRKASDKEVNDEFTFHDDQQPVRRKPTAEEAALTAKNYRLAKELVSRGRSRSQPFLVRPLVFC